MKKPLLLILLALFAFSPKIYSQACPGNLVATNADFSSPLTTGWSQYGSTTTAVILPITGGCINNTLALQATNNSDVGVSQPITLKRDSCYKLCYCYEFPQSGALFNAKLVVAVTNGTVTAAQLLAGAYLPNQAQIIDVITSTTAIAPTTQCIPTFTATSNYTTLVIVNQTIGNIGTDVRVDNVCLQRDACASSCSAASLVPGYTYVQTGLTLNFTNTSTVAPGYIMSYQWDFDDPASGPLNTSTLPNPSHTFPFPGAFVVCLKVTAIDPVITCVDSICIDITVLPVGVEENISSFVSIYPNPANSLITITGATKPERIALVNMYGQIVLNEKIQGTNVALPELPVGIYWVVIETNKGRAIKKLVISR